MSCKTNYFSSIAIYLSDILNLIIVLFILCKVLFGHPIQSILSPPTILILSSTTLELSSYFQSQVHLLNNKFLVKRFCHFKKILRKRRLSFINFLIKEISSKSQRFLISCQNEAL